MVYSPISGWNRFAWVLRVPWQSQCLWTTECHTCTHFTCTCSEWTFDNLLLHFACANNSGGCFLVFGSNGSLRWFFQCLHFGGQFGTSFSGLLLGCSASCLLFGCWLSLKAFTNHKENQLIARIPTHSTHLNIDCNTYGFCSGRLFGCWFLCNILFIGWFCGCCGLFGCSSLSITSWTFGCWFGLQIIQIWKQTEL